MQKPILIVLNIFLLLVLSSLSFADINTHSDLNSSHLEISDNNLIGYWNFDSDCENSSSSCTPATSYDMTGMNDGTYEGDAYVADGLYDNSLSVDGDGDYLNIPSYELLGNFSYSFLIKTSSVSNYAKIIGTSVSSGTNTDSGILFKTGTTGTLLCDISSSNIETSTIDTGTIVTTDDWVNIVLTGNREGDAIIYINGISSGSTDISAHSGNTIEGIAQFGTTLLSLSSGMDGSIDEVMIFNKALNQSEISDIYNNQSNKFKSQGNVTLKTINTNNTENKIVSLSIDSESTENITASLGRWGMSDGYNTHDNLVMHLPMENYTLGLMSDGVNDYIDTGIVPENSADFYYEAEGRFNDIGTSAFMGSRGDGTSLQPYFYFGVSSGAKTITAVYDSSAINSGISIDMTQTYKMRLYGDGRLFVDDVEVGAFTGDINGIVNSLYIGADNSNGDLHSPLDFTFTNIKIGNSSGLVRNFQPKSNGCFQELVNDVEYCNDGLGDLKVTTTDIKDISNNNLQASTLGEMDCTVDVQYSTGCSFPGKGSGHNDDTITIKHDDSLNYTDDGMTWSFWYELNSHEASVVFLDKTSINKGYAIKTTTNNDRYQITIRNGTASKNKYIARGSVVPNKLKNVIVTLKGQRLKLYENNIELYNDDIGIGYDGFANNEEDLIIGHRGFNGTMDDVMIFNKSLSEDEVTEIYTKGLLKYNYTDYQDMDSNFIIEPTHTSFSPVFNMISSGWNTPILYFNNVDLDFKSNTAPDVIIQSPTNNSIHSENFNITLDFEDLQSDDILFNLTLNGTLLYENEPAFDGNYEIDWISESQYGNKEIVVTVQENSTVTKLESSTAMDVILGINTTYDQVQYYVDGEEKSCLKDYDCVVKISILGDDCLSNTKDLIFQSYNSTGNLTIIDTVDWNIVELSNSHCEYNKSIIPNYVGTNDLNITFNNYVFDEVTEGSFIVNSIALNSYTFNWSSENIANNSIQLDERIYSYFTTTHPLSEINYYDINYEILNCKTSQCSGYVRGGAGESSYNTSLALMSGETLKISPYLVFTNTSGSFYYIGEERYFHRANLNYTPSTVSNTTVITDTNVTIGIYSESPDNSIEHLTIDYSILNCSLSEESNCYGNYTESNTNITSHMFDNLVSGEVLMVRGKLGYLESGDYYSTDYRYIPIGDADLSAILSSPEYDCILTNGQWLNQACYREGDTQVTEETLKVCNSISEQVYESFNLGIVALIILVAALIIGILMSAFGGSGIDATAIGATISMIIVSAILFIVGVAVFGMVSGAIC